MIAYFFFLRCWSEKLAKESFFLEMFIEMFRYYKFSSEKFNI